MRDFHAFCVKITRSASKCGVRSAEWGRLFEVQSAECGVRNGAGKVSRLVKRLRYLTLMAIQRSTAASTSSMLMTSAGLTFCVMPKSTCHTSPRSGTCSLLLIQRTEGRRGQRGKVRVGQVVRHGHALADALAQFRLLGAGKPLNLA
jgi:hypothetical protein